MSVCLCCDVELVVVEAKRLRDDVQAYCLVCVDRAKEHTCPDCRRSWLVFENNKQYAGDWSNYQCDDCYEEANAEDVEANAAEIECLVCFDVIEQRSVFRPRCCALQSVNYHEGCYQQWVAVKFTCPTCQREVEVEVNHTASSE